MFCKITGNVYAGDENKVFCISKSQKYYECKGILDLGTAAQSLER